MAKVTQSISLDLDDIELLNEIKARYHQPNLSQAIHTVIKQWQMFIDERKKSQQTTKDLPMKRPGNPQVMA